MQCFFMQPAVDRQDPTFNMTAAGGVVAAASMPILQCEATGAAAVNQSVGGSVVVSGCRLLRFAEQVVANDNVELKSLECLHNGTVVNAGYSFGPVGSDSTFTCTATDTSNRTATQMYRVRASE